ncbi:MAG: hypothetical protein ACJARR_003968 [Pseudophaeobacter arcticus]|jgi:hypothetical protein
MGYFKESRGSAPAASRLPRGIFGKMKRGGAHV